MAYFCIKYKKTRRNACFFCISISFCALLPNSAPKSAYFCAFWRHVNLRLLADSRPRSSFHYMRFKIWLFHFTLNLPELKSLRIAKVRATPLPGPDTGSSFYTRISPSCFNCFISRKQSLPFFIS